MPLKSWVKHLWPWPCYRYNTIQRTDVAYHVNRAFMDNNNLNTEGNYTDGNILKSFKDSVACNKNQFLSSDNNALQLSLTIMI